MLRAVMDTGALIGYALTGHEIMRRVVAHWRADNFVLLVSPSTGAELSDVLACPTVGQLSALPLDELARGLERFAEPVPGALDLSGACRDPKEDGILACAVEGEADYLVTSDHDLLTMRQHGEICIVNPGQFLLALQLHELPPDEIADCFAPQTLRDILSTMCLDATTEAKLRHAVVSLTTKAQRHQREGDGLRQDGLAS
jgi:putative PIN family toxin of toxin-antitoxin system